MKYLDFTFRRQQNKTKHFSYLTDFQVTEPKTLLNIASKVVFHNYVFIKHE